MNIKDLLNKANVGVDIQPEALACLKQADKISDGLLWAKWKVRLFDAGKISKLLEWNDERLIDVMSEYSDWDICPMINITAHGDNVPWDAATGRPVPGVWLNSDSESLEYQEAVKSNYWCKGKHPRSKKSRKAWYRRNAGEYYAYRLGLPVSLNQGVRIWSANGVTVLKCGDAWQVTAFKKLIGNFGLKIRIGYEIDNVFKDGVQQWYPIKGHELKAPITWSILPGFRKKED